MIAPSPALAAAVRRLSTPFGPIDVPEDQLLHFPAGILGLTSYKTWALLGAESAERFWLQSADEPSLTLPLLDPFVAFPGYGVDVPPTATAALGAGAADELLVLAPVTLGHGADATTANLRGPILINWNARRGLQLVVDAGPWSVREALPEAEAVG